MTKEFRPFEDKEELEKIMKKRDELIEQLQQFDIPEDQKRFILRRISIISNKLLERNRYAKDPK
jgi:hypothetical protein